MLAARIALHYADALHYITLDLGTRQQVLPPPRAPQHRLAEHRNQCSA
jgi:hypothetical protein